jgi:hypothetical protein
VNQCIHGGTHSAVLHGQYYKNLCSDCLTRLQANSPSSGHASFNRQQDYIDHQADVLQPHAGGKPHTAFIRAYPDKARAMFTPEEIREFG